MRPLLAAAVIVLSTAVVGCGGDETPSADPSTTTTATSTTLAPTTSPPATTSTSSPATTTSTAATVPPTTDPAGPAAVIAHGDRSRRTVALTFDAGSDAGYTARILDELASRHLLGTFGLTGRWVDQHPDLARRIAGAGHQVLNHTYDHPSFTGVSTGTAPLPRAQRLEQLARAEAAFSRVGATGRPWFRPPYGDRDASVESDVASAGYRFEVLWSLDSLGWQGLGAADIVARCLGRVAPGDVVLMHVGSGSQDALALPALLDGLVARGYGFETVAGLVG